MFNDDGPVYGPNGELELDPDLPLQACDGYSKPLFATCKNNCPGGEKAVSNFTNTNRLNVYLFYFQSISRLYQVRLCDNYFLNLIF